MIVWTGITIQGLVTGLQVQSPLLRQPRLAGGTHHWKINGIFHEKRLHLSDNAIKQHIRQRERMKTSLQLFQKIAESLQSLEAEYDREVKQANLSPLEIFRAEGEATADIPKAFQLMKERMAATTGDTETKLQLLEIRGYANGELLDKDHLTIAPNLDDLDQPNNKKFDRYWISPPFRMLVIISAYFFFPFLQKICMGIGVESVQSTEDFNRVASQFAPGTGVLYGTIVALTLDILYDRESRIQENITLEAGLLSQITQNALSLFDSTNDKDMARETSQLVAEQVRMLSTRTRGAELLGIMRADPYAQILGLIDEYHLENGYEFTPQQNSLTECLRQEIPEIMEARAKRLSDEASSLPPTHFLVLTILTALILVGYTVATLTLVDEGGVPSQEARVVFTGLTAIYVLFFNFCKDLNSPFDGVYQIKRSSAASYLLQVKWLISNQSFGKDIVFDDVHPIFKEDGSLLQKDVTVFGDKVVSREDAKVEGELRREKTQPLRQQRKSSSALSKSNDFSSTRKRRRRGREMRARLERGARNLATDILSSFQMIDEGNDTPSSVGRRYGQERKDVLRQSKQTETVADEVEKRVMEARRLAKEKQRRVKKEREEKFSIKMIESREKPMATNLVNSVDSTEDSEASGANKRDAGKKIVKKTGELKPNFISSWNDPSPAERRKMAQKTTVTILPCDNEDPLSDVALCTSSLSMAETILDVTAGTPTSDSLESSPVVDYFRRMSGTSVIAPQTSLSSFPPFASLSTDNEELTSVGLVGAQTKGTDKKSKAAEYFNSVGGRDASPSKPMMRMAAATTTIMSPSPSADQFQFVNVTENDAIVSGNLDDMTLLASINTEQHIGEFTVVENATSISYTSPLS